MGALNWSAGLGSATFGATVIAPENGAATTSRSIELLVECAPDQLRAPRTPGTPKLPGDATRPRPGVVSPRALSALAITACVFRPRRLNLRMTRRASSALPTFRAAAECARRCRRISKYKVDPASAHGADALANQGRSEIVIGSHTGRAQQAEARWRWNSDPVRSSHGVSRICGHRLWPIWP